MIFSASGSQTTSAMRNQRFKRSLKPLSPGKWLLNSKPLTSIGHLWAGFHCFIYSFSFHIRWFKITFLSCLDGSRSKPSICFTRSKSIVVGYYCDTFTHTKSDSTFRVKLLKSIIIMVSLNNKAKCSLLARQCLGQVSLIHTGMPHFMPHFMFKYQQHPEASSIISAAKSLSAAKKDVNYG